MRMPPGVGAGGSPRPCLPLLLMVPRLSFAPMTALAQASRHAPAQAISADSITGVSIGVIVVLVVIGLLIGLLIAKLIVRVVVALIVVVLAVVVWQQRGHVRDEFNTRVCNSDATFFGIHLDPSDELRQKCHIRGS